MISIQKVKYYCNDDITQIENYEKAINDNTQTWDCHHRKETDEGLSTKQLKEQNLLFSRPASELIFLTHSEHMRLHNKGENNPNYGKDHKGENNPMYGKTHSEESKKKQSESHKGQISWIKGKHHTEETKQKMSESHKGENHKGELNGFYRKRHSDESKQKMSLASKGRYRVYHEDGTYHYEK